MKPERLNAFSDGVIAIIITIMVLELKIPHGAGLSDLIPLIPIFFSYVLSFALRCDLLEQSPPHDARQRSR